LRGARRVSARAARAEGERGGGGEGGEKKRGHVRSKGEELLGDEKVERKLEMFK
jgi:hypothetical protein